MSPKLMADAPKGATRFICDSSKSRVLAVALDFLGREESLSSRGQELARMRSWIERVYSYPVRECRDDSVHTAELIATLPSFFVIGPPRTGTTWLYEVLRDRTILPAPTKETRFFDIHFHRGVEWYSAHFPSFTRGRKIGEVAPTYFASNKASERIARLLPRSKIVCIFRNPVERILSLYRLKCAYGLLPWTFEQALVRDSEMLESGQYATKLRDWQNALGHEQVRALIYDDLEQTPQFFLDTLLDFIEVPRFQLQDSQRQSVHSSETMTHPKSYSRTRNASNLADWFKARRLDRLVAAVRKSPLRKLFLGGGPPFTALPSEIIDGLYKYFRPEVEQLESILNRDLTAWKSAGEHAGNLQVAS